MNNVSSAIPFLHTENPSESSFFFMQLAEVLHQLFISPSNGLCCPSKKTNQASKQKTQQRFEQKEDWSLR